MLYLTQTLQNEQQSMRLRRNQDKSRLSLQTPWLSPPPHIYTKTVQYNTLMQTSKQPSIRWSQGWDFVQNSQKIQLFHFNKKKNIFHKKTGEGKDCSCFVLIHNQNNIQILLNTVYPISCRYGRSLPPGITKIFGFLTFIFKTQIHVSRDCRDPPMHWCRDKII